jgi:mRNA interferase RelE/StbE
VEIEFRSSFVRDAKKLSTQIKDDLQQAISIIIEANSIQNIPDIKSLKGGKRATNAYRMRIGDYRICFYHEANVIVLVRVLPRKNVYKFFP